MPEVLAMDPLAATTLASSPTPAVMPVSGAPGWGVSAVASPAVQSPAAATPTTWEAQAATTLAPEQLVEALAAAMATQQAEQAQAAPAQAQLGAQSLPLSGAVPTTTIAPPTTMTVAPTTQAAPAGMVASTQAALAGFASATGQVIGTVTGVAGAGVSRAKQVGTELWAGVRSPKAAHVTQVPSKFNKAPAVGNRDCGPTSVVIALKMLGKPVPGAPKSSTAQAQINQVRALAGSPDNTQSTSNLQLEQALHAAGATTREHRDFASIRRAITEGKPVILNGNPRNAGAYGPKFTAAQMTPYDGAHWITVTGIDQKTGQLIINDPLSKVGPVKVTPKQLEAYRAGSIGIEVAA